PFPTVQARNLFHVSAAMHDAWAAFDPEVSGLLVEAETDLPPEDRLIRIALGTAAVQVLRHRYALTNRDGLAMMKFERSLRDHALLAPWRDDEEVRAAELGHRVAEAIIARHADDGSNEQGRYLNASSYRPANPPLDPWRSGTSLDDPNRWQPIVVDGRTQRPVTPHWVDVRPFALPEREAGRPYLDPGPPPMLNEQDHAVLAAAMVELILLSSRIDGASGAPEADYGRVVAEYWEDGPATESPPGHWNLFALEVAERITAGMSGPERLRWEIELFAALNAALHDAAIACWDIKYHYDSIRPISLIRHMGALGQSSDPALPSHHPLGLPLVPGLIELVDAESSASSQRHEGLTPGELAIYCWRGNPDHPNTQVSGAGWMPATSWLPYQGADFITPAFPGYPSGHSTYSAAAATILALHTGSDEIPGGPIRFTAGGESFLELEHGPAHAVELEWHSFSEAAAEAGKSRLWGGIHPWFDDAGGQRVGREVARLVRERVNSPDHCDRNTPTPR
ncbi:MAG: vanadium-dependent haloperoxidase, partial [Phycisphaerales bacterium]